MPDSIESVRTLINQQADASFYMLVRDFSAGLIYIPTDTRPLSFRKDSWRPLRRPAPIMVDAPGGVADDHPRVGQLLSPHARGQAFVFDNPASEIAFMN